MSRNIAFSRPATYNPSLVRKASGLGDDADDEARRQQKLKEELGLGDEDDNDDESESTAVDTRRKTTDVTGDWKRRCEEAMAKLKVAMENEEKAQSSLNNLQLLSKSQTAILKSTFDKKLRSKELMVADLLQVIADHESKLKKSGIQFDAFEASAAERTTESTDDGANDAVAPLKAQIDSLTAENAQLRTKLAASRTSSVASSPPVAANPAPPSDDKQTLKKIATLEHEKQSLLQLLKDAQMKLNAQKASATMETPPPAPAVDTAATKELEKKCAKMEADLKKAMQKIEASEKELATLKSANTSSGDKIKLAEAETQLAAVNAKMTEMEATAQAKQDKLKQAAEADLAKLKEQAKRSILDLQKRLDANNKVNNEMKARLTKAKSEIAKQKIELKTLRGEVTTLVAALSTGTKDLATKIETRVRAQTDALAGVVENYKREMKERKRLFNLVQELQGNIRVLCRFRPISKSETANGSKVVAKFSGHEEVSLVGDKGKSKTYEFEHVFDMSSTQEQVFAQVKPLITSVLDGFNVCIFAYGQTGSGKTFTMSGSTENPGINPRALNELFGLKNARSREFNDDITVSIMEIYNEVIRDLLAENAANTNLSVRQGTNGNFVQGLTMVPVKEVNDVFNLITKGNQNRSTHATDMNEHSSRSHSILSIYVKSTNLATNTVANGKLHLVDLAGSERLSKTGAEGQRLKEAQNINQSLSTLGNVIQARANKQKHVPYRDSSLTYLLQDSLGGDSKTLMVACSSPVDYNAEESFCTLNFASRARCVEMGKATKHVTKSKD
ncbi:hypothetical protein LEN26_015334 [Aphanomyces euteiches]|nr:hypothetical protein LEN26_015334 [Aphanomyces euteiches]KAH9126959.1 hypothetical protein AeMF1_002733 [Aphanomyces euteiches]KAH9193084.1 hypothetical protein AeNC1_004939 [Aphanomyces euteiches]